MINREQYIQAQQKTVDYMARAGIVLTPDEAQNIEVADFGLNRLHEIGLEIVVYVNTDRVCAKELVLFPGQICPEHRHPPVLDEPGKEETFRCRWGQVFLYIPGEASPQPAASLPRDKVDTFTVWREIILHPGDQYTLQPDTLHWFQGGPDGAVVSEFSTTSRDDADIFTDPEIHRITHLAESPAKNT
ncbi:D-lyxose/D-mannose family sugar isomerase [candidate division KSB1 bacterium]|nr:D-lyxose/D-mannose family sugar isomerase [candidate division KSB1 bacterium]RQW05123.1 MAG: D-lyxose/D-mannose family sugar isomerase [candidate division KSB1 bacterium]